MHSDIKMLVVVNSGHLSTSDLTAGCEQGKATSGGARAPGRPAHLRRAPPSLLIARGNQRAALDSVDAGGPCVQPRRWLVDVGGAVLPVAFVVRVLDE